MTFFDKFFTIRNRNSKTENGLKLAVEPLRSSLFDITKEQIRVVLFRECDRRGRKLLFDSNTVEKLPLGSHIKTKDFMCKTKCDQLSSGKFLDFVEVTNSHGYRYKKPCNDVTLLGEMIFGSVAMVFKGGSTCKIHSLASPKCVMFTNIVHAPGQCHYQPSRHCTETSSGACSLTSLNDNCGESRTCSSDSKLYRPKCNATTTCGTSTYPCLRQKSVLKRLQNNCESEFLKSECEKKPVFRKSSNVNCLDKICFGESNNHERTSGVESARNCFTNDFDSDQLNFFENSEVNASVLQDKMEESYCNCSSSDAIGTFSGFYECSKDSSNANSLNSSLSSLRRRWMQSCSSSIDQIHSEDKDSMKSKARTKLGMGLVIDLTNSLEDELEKFLFNHTIVIESILNKLQSSIQTAYVRKENFVDLTYAAFTNCQQSMYELITGGKYTKPMWLAFSGISTEDATDSESRDKVYSRYHENIKDCKKQDGTHNAKLKFLNDFCDILTKYDTKDTNFFISTLLTAVLTHHLSWVTGIAESDILLPQHKLQCVIKGLRPYNPIWAQLNDLNGILGSPLKSARTVIAGSETNKNSIASIIQVLTYFIRCYNVVENVYDFDIEEVTSVDEANVDRKENLNCEIRNLYRYAPEPEKPETELKCDLSEEVETEKWTCIRQPDVRIVAQDDFSRNLCSDALQTRCAADGLKKSKSCLSRLEEECFAKDDAKFYSDIEDCSRLASISVSNVGYPGDKMEKEVINDFLLADVYSKKVQKLIRVPSKVISCHLEQNLSPDEGYDTVDSCTVADVYPKARIEDENAKYSEERENVLFVLGENEELVNLKKVVMTKSSVIDVEKEDAKELLPECKKIKLCRSKSVNIPVSNEEDVVAEMCRTFRNALHELDEAVSRETYSLEMEHSNGEKGIRDGIDENVLSLHELPMPRGSPQKFTKRRLDISSVLGSVNDHYNSEQIIQGILADKNEWEKALRKDLALCAHNPVLDRDVTEALCIIGDMNSWEVSLCSSRNFVIERNSSCGIRIGMSQLVADMLESLLHIWRIKLPADFCLGYIEKKLHEIYSKSKSVAELLSTTEMCSMEYLTSRLDISVNDVPLLLSVATTHSPNISSKYGLTFT